MECRVGDIAMMICKSTVRFRARQAASLVPIPDWLCPYKVTVVIAM